MEEEKTIQVNLTSPVEKVAPLFVVNTQVTALINDKTLLLAFHSGSPVGEIQGKVQMQAILAGTFALPLSQVKRLKEEIDRFLKEVGEL